MTPRSGCRCGVAPAPLPRPRALWEVRTADPIPLLWPSCRARCGRSDARAGGACARAAATGQSFYLYGGRNQGALAHSRPPFREEEAVTRDINSSCADVVWVGIGVPKQEKWMAAMRDTRDASVLVGVGNWVRRPCRPRAAGTRLQTSLRGRVRPTVRRSSASTSASAPAMSYDVSVIGLGRVGLPRALDRQRDRARCALAHTVWFA